MNAERNAEDLSHAIGECLMAWSEVEWNLCLLYCECVSPKKGKFFNPDPHAAIFDSVISIDARMDMVRAIIDWKISSNEAPKLKVDSAAAWKILRAKIRKKYSKRNEVAHSSAVQYSDKDGRQKVELQPFSTYSSFSSKSNFLTLDDLRERKRSFRLLAMEVSAFRNQLYL